MKDKILMLVIGILIGAIIASACFLLFGKNNNSGERINGKNFDANMIEDENFDSNVMGGGKMGRPNRGESSTEDTKIVEEEGSDT